MAKTQAQKGETPAAVFNDMAERVADDVQRYEKAIAVMKDMQDNWGKDSKGRYFTFEAAYDDLSRQTILVGTLHNHHGIHGGPNVPTLFVGLPPDAAGDMPPAWCEFVTAQRWTDPSAPMSDRIREAYIGAGPTYLTTKEQSANAVVAFAQNHMNDHPGFKRAIQDAAQKVINKIPAQGLKQ